MQLKRKIPKTFSFLLLTILVFSCFAFLFPLVQSATLYSDGFESGDLSEWETNGAPTVTTDIKHHGTYAANITSGSNNIYQSIVSTSGTTYARAYIYLPSLPASGASQPLFLLRANGTASLVIVSIVNTAGVYSWSLTTQLSDWSTNNVNVEDSILAATWYCIELKYSKYSATGGQLWINGTLTATQDAGNSYNADPDLLYIPDISYVNYGVIVDCVEVADSYIGVEGAEPTPTPEPTPEPPAGDILCLGDSITEGGGNPTYPEYLEILTGLNVTNGGYTGYGSSQLSDLWYNTYNSAGYEYLCTLMGVNDLWSDVNASVVEANLENIWRDALENQSLTAVFALTMTPCMGYSEGWSASRQANLTQVNEWIMNASAINPNIISINVYSLLENQTNPGYLNSTYDGGDGLHPNQAFCDLLATEVYNAWLAFNEPGPTPTPTPSPSPSPTATATPTPEATTITISLAPIVLLILFVLFIIIAFATRQPILFGFAAFFSLIFGLYFAITNYTDLWASLAGFALFLFGFFLLAVAYELSEHKGAWK